MYYVEIIYIIVEIKYFYIYDIINIGFCVDIWCCVVLI